MAEYRQTQTVFTFQRLTRNDFPMLAGWLAEPHVARWWNHEYSSEALERDFSAVIDGLENAEDYIASLDGEPVGVMQYCRFVDYPTDVAEMADVYPVGADTGSIDYLLGDPDRVGRGLGTVMIRSFVERVWSHDPTVTHLVVPVNSTNEASWRALLSAGFTLVARGNLEPDNPIDDPLHEVLRIDRPNAEPLPRQGEMK